MDAEHWLYQPLPMVRFEVAVSLPDAIRTP
jgi:hypothetical protein